MLLVAKAVVLWVMMKACLIPEWYAVNVFIPVKDYSAGYASKFEM